MYSKLIRRKNYSNEILPLKSNHQFKRNICSKYFKYFLILLIIYYFNIFLSLKSSYWFEKSFESESHLTIEQFDYMLIETNPQLALGQPKYHLNQQFLIENQYFCFQSRNQLIENYPHILILIKSFPNHFQQRQTIRITWGQTFFLSVYQIKLAFILGK